jgi:hypothetical protein
MAANNIPSGTANVSTDSTPKATASPDNIASLPAVTVTASRLFNFPNLVINPLERLSSYNALWTMAALTPEQYNNPLSYRKDPNTLENIVFSSAGRYDEQRIKIDNRAAPEYYVNNFTMVSLITNTQQTGVSNSITFSFEIFEPFSMGLFLQSLQSAAINAGYVNYLKNCPYLLKLDLVGYQLDDDTTNALAIRNVSRYFVVRLQSIEYDVTEAGSVYKCSCIAYNQQGFSDIIDRTWPDIKLTGTTVKEMLSEGENSLSVVLRRESEKKQKAAKIATADEYLIVFPDLTPTKAPENPIASSSMSFDMTNGGSYMFSKESETYTKEGVLDRRAITIDPSKRAFHFAQGQKITNIITEVVMVSEWGKKLADSTKIAADGTIDWFKIDVQIELKEYDPVQNDFAKRINYLVIPYKVHSSIVMKPTANGAGYSELQKIIAKKYSYIYTGENNDLLSFSIDLKTNFYTAIAPGLKSQSGTNDPATNSAANTKIDNVTNPAAEVGETVSALSKMGYASFKEDGTMYLNKRGGAGNDDVRAAIARDFHNAVINNNVDLINIEFEILGDPYWLTDSGIANYYSVASLDNPAVTIDGAMTYEGQDVYVYLSFSTPFDINEETGLYDRIEQSPFSGIYKIVTVTSKFSDGTFKQTIKAIRMKGQPEDFDKTPPPTPKNQIKQQEVSGSIDASSFADPGSEL